MAQAYAKIIGGDRVAVFSAGSNPSGKINPRAIEAMRQAGFDLTSHHSKSLNEVERFAPFDVIVTMGCGDACPWMPTMKTVDWQIPDPRFMNEEEFLSVRDLIKLKVEELIASLDD